MATARRSADDPSAWTGTRTPIQMQGKCGWCSTSNCDECIHELAWFEKLWICGCQCNAKWEPKNLTANKEANK